MDFGALFKHAGKVAADNSPAILTAIGVTGTLATAYLAAKAAFKSVDVLREAEVAKEAEFQGETPELMEVDHVYSEGLTTQEKVEAVWRLYVPAAASAALTVAAIIFSNNITDRRTAAMASAYSVAEKSYAEYRAKVASTIGKKKEQEVRDQIAQDRVDRNPPVQEDVIIVNGRSTLCKETWSERFFTGDIEFLRTAVNDLNQKIIHENYASLNDFWELIGIPPTVGGNYVGWTTDKLLEIKCEWATTKDGRCLVVDFVSLPVSRYDASFR